MVLVVEVHDKFLDQTVEGEFVVGNILSFWSSEEYEEKCFVQEKYHNLYH